MLQATVPDGTEDVLLNVIDLGVKGNKSLAVTDDWLNVWGMFVYPDRTSKRVGVLIGPKSDFKSPF